jgi:hypothetical protein
MCSWDTGFHLRSIGYKATSRGGYRILDGEAGREVRKELDRAEAGEGEVRAKSGKAGRGKDRKLLQLNKEKISDSLFSQRRIHLDRPIHC